MVSSLSNLFLVAGSVRPPLRSVFGSPPLPFVLVHPYSSTQSENDTGLGVDFHDESGSQVHIQWTHSFVLEAGLLGPESKHLDKGRSVTRVFHLFPFRFPLATVFLLLFAKERKRGFFFGLLPFLTVYRRISKTRWFLLCLLIHRIQHLNYDRRNVRG